MNRVFGYANVVFPSPEIALFRTDDCKGTKFKTNVFENTFDAVTYTCAPNTFVMTFDDPDKVCMLGYKGPETFGYVLD